MLTGQYRSLHRQCRHRRHARRSRCCCRSRAAHGGTSSARSFVLMFVLTLHDRADQRERARAHGLRRARHRRGGRAARRCSCRSMRSARCFRNAPAWCRATTSARQGRFGRHLAGFLLMLDHPIGIGPMQFTRLFHRRPAQLVPECIRRRRLARRRRPRHADGRRRWGSACATCSSARRGSASISRSTRPSPPKSARATSSTCSTGGTFTC